MRQRPRRRRAQELDPVSPTVHVWAGFGFYHARQYDQSIEEARKAIELDPNAITAYNLIVRAYADKKMYDEAIAEGQKARIIAKGHPYSKGLPYSLGSLGYAYAVAGKPQEARQILAELKDLSGTSYISSYYTAMIHAGLGEKDQAMDSLEKLYQEREEFLSTLKVDPPFDVMRSDPRFIDLLHRVNLAP